MTDRLTAYKFEDIYKDLGVDTNNFGYIMADVQPLPVVQFLPHGEEDLYFSPKDTGKYIQGAVGEKTAHVTLLGGLLQPGPEIQKQVDRVLEGWSMETVAISHIGVFPSPKPDENYGCIVGHLVISDALQEAHDRLSFLPHVDFFPGFKAHVTLAYVKADDPTVVPAAIRTLNAEYMHEELRVLGINYGGEK